MIVHLFHTDTCRAAWNIQNNNTMSTNEYYTSTPWKVCSEWVEKFVDIRMKIQDKWWRGCNGSHYHDSHMSSYDIPSAKWNLRLDDPVEPIWPLRWDTVYQYADRSSSTFNDYLFVSPEPVMSDAAEPVTYKGKKYKRTKPKDWTFFPEKT